MKFLSHKFFVVLAFATIYITWGTTYLAIAITLKDMTPFFMSALRFLIAGLLLLLYCIYKKEKWPSGKEITKSGVCALLMLVGGTAAIAWAEQHIPSGIAAITNTTVPFWFVLLDKKQWKYYFSSKWIIGGLITGFAGTVLLLSHGSPGASTSSPAMQLLSILVLVFGCGILWTCGSLYSKYHPSTLSAPANICIQLFTGGLTCLLISFSSEPVHLFSFTHIHNSTWLALAYLIIVGNIVAYMVYIWLLKIKPPAIVSTYAYVSPLIAVLAGWLIAGDSITITQLIAFGIILCGVLFVNIPRYKGILAFSISRASKLKAVTALLLCLFFVTTRSQTHEQKNLQKKSAAWKHRLILIQALKDSSNNDEEIKLDEMIIPPGGSDTISHQHTAHLTGYLLEGEVITKMRKKPPQTIKTGQAFYEFPDEVHEYIKNTSLHKQARVLLYYLYKKNAALYKKVDIKKE
jgi:drug/metabolite transporter (DMT)-like permease/quercetin dioxygenase-like cupin family protein